MIKAKMSDKSKSIVQAFLLALGVSLLSPIITVLGQSYSMVSCFYSKSDISIKACPALSIFLILQVLTPFIAAVVIFVATKKIVSSIYFIVCFFFIELIFYFVFAYFGHSSLYIPAVLRLMSVN